MKKCGIIIICKIYSIKEERYLHALIKNSKLQERKYTLWKRQKSGNLRF